MRSNVLNEFIVVSLFLSALLACVYNLSTSPSYKPSVFTTTVRITARMNAEKSQPSSSGSFYLPKLPRFIRDGGAPVRVKTVAPPTTRNRQVSVETKKRIFEDSTSTVRPSPRGKLVDGPVRTPIVNDPLTPKPVVSDPITPRRQVSDPITPKPFVDPPSLEVTTTLPQTTNASTGVISNTSISSSVLPTTTTPRSSYLSSTSTSPASSTTSLDSRARYQYSTTRTRPRTCNSPPPVPLNKARSWPAILPATYCYGDFIQKYLTLKQVEVVGPTTSLRFADDTSKSISAHRKQSACEENVECIRFSYKTEKDFLSREVLKTYDMCDPYVSSESFVIVDGEQNCIPKHGYRLPSSFLPDSRRKSF